MTGVSYCDDKAAPIASISVMGSFLALLWLLLLLLPKREPIPWWVWAIVLAVSAVAASVIFFFVFYLITVRAIISERSLARAQFGKRREIKKEDIYLIADEFLGRNRFYVVYPKGCGEEAIKRHASPTLSEFERAKIVQKDKRLLLFLNTQKTSALLSEYGYRVTMRID